jgi:hypothetical protein
MFKDLLNAAGSKETVSSNDDMEACKLEIKETQKMLQETQKPHYKENAKRYELLRNLLSVTHSVKHDLWAGANGQVIVGRCPRTWATF